MIPAIFGCSGPSLTEKERAFFAKVKPAGFILFARNIESREQVAALTADMKKTVGRHKVAILIDQEGGRVQRMTAPHWRKYPPMAVFGDMARHDPTLAASALRLNCRLLADDLRRVGITVNCLPLLDVRQRNADPIIGDRAFSSDPQLVASFGKITIDALQAGGILPVIKHIPGHGRATVDSHLDLPVVDTPLATLDETDFAPFRALKDAAFGMTAHIIYSDIDAEKPATLSRLVIARIIRMRIGFSGLLMTDDLSMKALKGDIGTLASDSIKAGCDLVLHCNGDMAEMRSVAENLTAGDNSVEKRLATLIRNAEHAPVPDRADLKRRYEELMSRF
ncbi:beta-N-acetylhexosaminidase [Kordiimonas pumila]|uniref:beta-N-acetylhexosaminidase n=1 Tax=Kordiimonas pumila TaxID=2161677 RepID=A0ABV7D2Q4_9PROT|nr:beta-N-acetylhexosaminidase [Kordiimonas pumila]